MKKSFKTIVAGVLALVMALSIGMAGILGTWEGVSLEAKDAAYTGLEANDENWTEDDSLIYFRDSSPYSILSEEFVGFQLKFNDHFKELMGGDYYPLFHSRRSGLERERRDIRSDWLHSVDVLYPQYSKQAYELWVTAVNHYEETGEYAFNDLVHFYRDLWVLEKGTEAWLTANMEEYGDSEYNGLYNTLSRQVVPRDEWADLCFEDIVLGSYYWKGLVWAVNANIIVGTAPKTFSPDKTCTDAEILTMLWRTVHPMNKNWVNPFDNVDEYDWYFFPAKWAAEEGLISGGYFDTSKPCTRAMVVTYLWKLAGSPDVAYNGDFSDVADGTDLAKAVAWAIQQGITNGTGNGKFSPDDTCTRAQIVTFLFRAYATERYKNYEFLDTVLGPKPYIQQ